MTRRAEYVGIGILIFLFLAFPFFAKAYPFGGAIQQIIYCYNNAIYTSVGPPNGGPFIWTPSTKTYQFGPPSHTGQWLLGLAAPPYYCIVSREPIIVWSGILMTMIGSSGPSAPSLGGGGSGGALPTNPTQPTNPPKTPQPLPAGTPPSAPASPTLGHVVVSEVYYAVDGQHGNDPLNQWFELYNGTKETVDLSGWVMANQDGTSTIPNGYVLPPNSFAMVTQSSDTKNRWTIPNTSLFIILGRPIGAGLHGEGDKLTIRTKTLEPVDNVSWGGNSSVFPVPPKTVPLGHSMGRKSLTVDTNTIADWIDIEVPTPGK